VDELKPGDLVFVRGHSFLSFLIRLFDKGKWSHCAIATSEKHVLETDWNTDVRIREFDYPDYEIIDLGLSEEQRKEIIRLGINCVGTPYDFGFIMNKVKSKLFGRSAGKKILSNPQQMVCSEVLTYLLLNIRWINTDEMKKVADSTPNELYKFIKDKLNN
jgi:hypothetical protein